MPRVKLFNEEEALNEAMKLFWEKGYHATSLTDLTKRLGLGKGSFYAAFDGKRALFDRTLEQYRQSNTRRLIDLLYSEQDVKIGIRKLLEQTMEHALSDSQHKGCFVANTCSELGGSDLDVATMLREHQHRVHNIITEYLELGEPWKNADAQQLASLIMTFLTGMNQEVKFSQDRSKFQDSIDLIIKLME